MARKRVAIVGSGLIGRSWAIVFVRAGCEVTLYDSDEAQSAKALAWIGATLDELAQEGLDADPAWLLSFVRAAATLVQAVATVDHVQECVGEDLALKQQVFAELDRLTPMSAVIASSTSAFMPSLMFSALEGRHRCVVAHPMNPPHLAPIVEICAAPFTYPETAERVRNLMLAGGQVPVTVNREIDGFILNRLQLALLNEALRLVAGGYVSPDDLDQTVKSGLALRWSFMGPLETIDLNAPGGTADYFARYGAAIRRVGKDLCAQPAWPDDVAAILHQNRRRRVPLSELENEALWRDRRMMALARHKREAAEKYGK
jgi:3-hydroxyacyl-CoA dehydrogenase